LSEESNEISYDSDREEYLFILVKTNIFEDKGKEMMDSEEVFTLLNNCTDIYFMQNMI
jgi:hypothetical protein